MYGSSVFRVARTSSVRYFKNGSNKKLLEFLASMPKANTARITEAQQQRHHISKKSEKYGPSTVYLQVLGSGARGVPNTLYLFTDHKRYLFNCGECTQRLAHEHKVKLSRLEHVFITRKTWKNIGGLPGLSLTLQDVGVPEITLHGPEGLDELYNATKRFVIMKEMQVNKAPSSPLEDYEDSVMTVKYIHMFPRLTMLQDIPPQPPKRARLGDVPALTYDQFTRDKTDYYNCCPEGEESKSPTPRSSRSPDHRERKKDFIDIPTSVAYICTLKKRLGSLDLAKCVEKGVPPGPLLGQLKSGIDVVLADGTLVMSKEVTRPEDPGPVFIVLEVPEISYLSEELFQTHFDNGTNLAEHIPTLIVHMTPPEVFRHKKYQSFMAKFGPTTQHLILNSQNSCLGSEAVHRTQHKLHLLDPEVFPLLKDPSIPAEWNPHPPVPKTNSPTKIKGIEDLKNRFQNIINAEVKPKDYSDEIGGPKLEIHSSRTLTMFHLRPKREIDRSVEPKLHIQDYYQETMDVEGFVGCLDNFRAQVQSLRYANNANSEEYPKVVFLGTGSCIPSKTRNTSAIIVHVDDQSTILLDCGEGTFGQLVRFYGPRKVDELLRTLKAIYISHLHADHHIGLIGVLQARAAAFTNAPEKNVPLLLLAPGQIVTWLTKYDKQFEKIAAEYMLIPNQNLMNPNDSALTPTLLASIGLESVLTCLVPHCPNAFGVAITAAGHKITYSGDTLPTDKLVKIGHDSTILIHEATMEDELADEARIKMHSTTSQAIEIGRKMNAKYTVLTHFSQRYARLPRLYARVLTENNVGIAFDNMQVTLSDLPLLPHMYGPLQLMFAEHCVDMELKAASRERRKEKSSTNIPGTKHSSTGNTSKATEKSNVKETVDSVAQIKDNIENVAIDASVKQT
ncbi:ribonuclease Z, mitochondrial isoform X4 [Leguminivora glycinivorella]|uniref:ribonuclease Z, mitochondrial isoform X4 n=1 Tax=Leguminivora glycinivorella TaxID=1035111 RepID=UPI00200F0E75|nr:ribonuclease Z, mitochondrial isoform X4 [Leguminivora glycinivorella]